MKKNIQILLLVIAGIIATGLIFRWSFNTWKFIDIVIIIILIIICINSFQDKNLFDKNFIKNHINKQLLYILLGVGFIVVVVITMNLLIEKQKKTCHFSVTNIKENRYQNDKDAIVATNPHDPMCSQLSWQDRYMNRQRFGITDDIYNATCFGYKSSHVTYWEIDGLLKNNSKTRHYIKSIVLKIYTKDKNNILLAEKFIDIEKYLQTNQTYPFQIKANLNREDPILSKYFNKEDDVRIDVYPYFLSCSY